MTLFGVEEEFVLLDDETLAPVPLGYAARTALHAPGGAVARARSEPPVADPTPATEPPPTTGTVSKEFLTCQVEFSTSPASTRDALGAELRAFRRELSLFAARHRSIAMGTGTPFGTGAPPTLSPSARYQIIANWLGHIVQDHQVNGLHVHTEIADVEQRVQAMNALRPWLPALLALAGNSPFWHGADTGYASWRSILLRRLPTIGCPPWFRDADDYRRTADRLIALRIAPDIASLCWMARLSHHLPTVEVRVFDAQLSVDDTLFLAALTRALLVSARPQGAPLSSEEINASLWMAAREGMDASLLHPLTGEPSHARIVVQQLLRLVAPALQDAGDLAFVEEHLARILREGTGAQRQRRAFAAGGISGLRDLSAGEPLPTPV